MNSNTEFQDGRTAVKKKSILFKIIKWFAIASGTGVFLAVIFALWVYVEVFSGPGIMEISEFHPFKSENAKKEYLSFEDEMEKCWPLNSEKKTVQTSYGSTFMRVSGPADAPPLVLLPGGGSNSLIWFANIESLSEEYRTYALDNIYDFGRSVYTRKIESGNDFAGWLDELFDSLRLRNDIRIIGYSYGGWVASQYALRHQERLSRAVLVAPASTVMPISGEMILDMISTLIPVRYFKEKTMNRVAKDLVVMGGDKKKKIVDDRVDFLEMAYKCFKFKSLPNPVVLTDSELQSLKIPVFYLVGSNETVCNPDSAINRLNKAAPLIKTELISGTGHDLLFTHTEIVNGMILKFLK
ncbi:MAG: alpha/beta fold hydrolase [Ignavibacteria bacterium]